MIGTTSLRTDDSIDRKSAAAISALIGIRPRDELEGAMECYRRAMIGEQTFDGRLSASAEGASLSL
jgi:hypothetical protein